MSGHIAYLPNRSHKKKTHGPCKNTRIKATNIQWKNHSRMIGQNDQRPQLFGQLVSTSHNRPDIIFSKCSHQNI